MWSWHRAVICVVFVISLAAACGTPATEIIVVVDTDLDVPSELSMIVVEVTSPSGEMSTATAMLEGDANIPATVGLVHEDGAIGPFQVRARGQDQGGDVIERQASAFFLPEKTLTLAMHLLRSCLGQSCPDTETCTDDGCRPQFIGALPEWTGTAPRIGDGPDGDADADGDGDGDGDADIGPRPIVLYTFEDLTDLSAVSDVASGSPDVSLSAAARDPVGVTIVDGGVEISGGRLEASMADSRALGDALMASGSFTVEIWVQTTNATQTGPARIVTYSTDGSQRAFTLGQEGANFVTRTRTTATGLNGTTGPSGSIIHSTTAFPATTPRQLVLVFDGDTATTSAYVDGEHGGDQEHRTDGGDLATLNWQTSSERFGLGDEFVDTRPWSGTIELVAIFDRSLTAAEVEQLFTSGPDGGR